MSELVQGLVPEAFHGEVLRLIEEDHEVRALSLMLPAPKLFEWAHTIGVRRHESLARLVPPLPPTALRERVAEPEPEIFLWTGLADAHMVLETLERVGPRPTRRLRVLDFGCGCGRQLRFLAGLDHRLEVHGVDVNPDLVAWCSGHLEGIEVVLGEPTPPLPHPDGFFDFVYSLSVFTHLGEAGTRTWLEEMARVIAPGGVILLTIHGPLAIARIKGSEALQEITGVDATTAATLDRRLAEDGFVFVSYAEDRLEDAKAGEEYGITFLGLDYLRSIGGDLFEIVEHRVGGMRGWQDTVALRRR